MPLDRLVATRSVAAADRVGSWIAPAMPWLFLGLRRALVPVLAWALVAVFFFAVPQSREVLHGLSEPVLGSLADFTGPAKLEVNWLALLSYLVTATLLALSIWYAARLLCTVDSKIATPYAFREAPQSDRLLTATIFLPRLLGVSALWASVSAMIYANCVPPLPHIAGLAISFLAGGGPLIIALAWLMGVSTFRQKAWFGTGVLLYAGSLAGILHANHHKIAVPIFCGLSALLPALLCVFLVRRRKLIRRMSPASVAPIFTPEQDRQFGQVIVTLAVMVVLGAAASLLLGLAPPRYVRRVGSAGTVLLFMVSAVLLTAGLQLVLRRVAREVPSITTTTLLLVSAMVMIFGSESLGTETLVGNSVPSSAGPGDFHAVEVDAQRLSAAPPTEVQPRVYVNAYGGGLRAAIFTAEVLAMADDATCGDFGTHVIALSGVSGGSVGIATYLVSRQDVMAHGGWKDCAQPSASHTRLAARVTQALVQDHLSTALARMLAVDVQHFPGSPQRGQALLDSWQAGLLEALETADAVQGAVQHQAAAVAPPPSIAFKPQALAMSLGALTGGLPKPPSVYFNSTDADTGQIIWFSNLAHGVIGDNTTRTIQSSGGISVGQAVLHSARFPVISPAGRLQECTSDGQQVLRLVDGGYADNSGATTLLLREIGLRSMSGAAAPWLNATGSCASTAAGIPEQPPSVMPSNAYLVDLDGNPPDTSTCLKAAQHDPPILTALRALLAVRAAHAELAVQELSVSIKKLSVPLDLEAAYRASEGQTAPANEICAKVRRAQQAPLGWYVSYSAAQSMTFAAANGVTSVLTGLGLRPIVQTPRIRTAE